MTTLRGLLPLRQTSFYKTEIFKSSFSVRLSGLYNQRTTSYTEKVPTVVVDEMVLLPEFFSLSIRDKAFFSTKIENKEMFKSNFEN